MALVTCASDVERSYFTSKKGFPACCFACGAADPLQATAEQLEKYQSIHMPCHFCSRNGIKPRTRGERKVGASQGRKRKTLIENSSFFLSLSPSSFLSPSFSLSLSFFLSLPPSLPPLSLSLLALVLSRPRLSSLEV